MSETEGAPYRFIYEEKELDGKKVRIYKLGKYGKELVEKIPGLATDSRVTYVLERLMQLEDFVEEEVIPFFKDSLLGFLKVHPDTDTKELHKHLYVGNDFRRRVNFEAKDRLEREGKIESVKVGRGKPRKWRIKETKK